MGKRLHQLAAQVPNKFAIHDNYPNPFNPTTTINYDLPEQSIVTMTIYNFLGRKVRTLVNDVINAGYKSAVWNSKNDFGVAVASGIYLLTVDVKGLDSGEHHSSKMKLILIK